MAETAQNGDPAAKNGGKQDPPDPLAVPLGLAAFVGFMAAGIISPLAFNAIAFSSDILPLREDWLACLGIDADSKERRIDWKKAFPTLIFLVIIILITLLSEPVMNGYNLATDFLPIRGDFRTLFGVGGE